MKYLRLLSYVTFVDCMMCYIFSWPFLLIRLFWVLNIMCCDCKSWACFKSFPPVYLYSESSILFFQQSNLQWLVHSECASVWILPSYDCHTRYTIFSWTKWKTFSHHPLLQEDQEKPNKNSKVGFAILLKCGFMRTKKKIPPLQRNLVICRSFFMYVQWLGKNYCICEGTYLWFKA